MRLFGLKLLGAQKNRLITVNNFPCYIGPKSAHVLSCFILNNFGPPSAHAFHWWLWWMDGRTDRQICDQLAGMKAIKQCTCNHCLLTSLKVQIGITFRLIIK